MLRNVTVEGFRSLRSFRMEIKPGLNILVGPNGAGKTNIILFFDFLRNLTGSSLSDAIGRAGGIAQVFAKRGKNSFADTIVVSLQGIVQVDESQYPYSLDLELNFSQSRQDVVFCRQELKVDQISQVTRRSSVYMHVIYEPPTSPDSGGIRILKFPEPERNTRSWVREEIKRLEKRNIFSTNCVLSFLQHVDEALATVAADFSGRFILNVVPSHVKKPEDSTREPGIDSDGSGLSATLYAIKKKRSIAGSRALRPFLRMSDLRTPEWSGVMDLVRVAVPSIEDIDVENDPFDNLLRCRITVGKGNKSSVVPLGALSDGTVKWMSLVVRLLTSREALLLEEPENYLHPLMQREIVRLLRDSVGSSSFMMLSTHSETLLNAVRPDELIVVGYEKGGTKANRVSNSADVEAEINRTGFGLGYYYLADAVESCR
ncbi:AAA family ATPase [Luteimonas marina]|uniref:AAA family ATPase n=1 Tax=Luteimonas marina TaxID=488485 RepID=A0A5C5UDH2_9GAMM|nr:AAA family ATPase [Luteimonas marina]TWT23545.1 AAA family ATPase [Luteimonas marina]